MMLKIILAEDHIIVRNGIKLILDSQPGVQVIGEADNGKEVLDLIASGTIPDIVLTDINMPEMDGISLIRELKEKWPDIKTCYRCSITKNTLHKPFWKVARAT
jgi:YesN/AraC family two-component response regulator